MYATPRGIQRADILKAKRRLRGHDAERFNASAQGKGKQAGRFSVLRALSGMFNHKQNVG